MRLTRKPVVTLIATLTIVCVLAALLVFLLRQSEREKPAPPTETPRLDLVQISGRWYRSGQTNPFTGWMVDNDPGGARLSHWQISNGLLNGLSEIWYTNGQIQVREFYRTNFSDGLRTKWYPDGRKLSEATIVLGRIQGLYQRWYENGRLAEEIPMRDGKIEGVGQTYYESGFVKTELKIHDGNVIQSNSWPDGKHIGGR